MAKAQFLSLAVTREQQLSKVLKSLFVRTWTKASCAFFISKTAMNLNTMPAKLPRILLAAKTESKYDFFTAFQ